MSNPVSPGAYYGAGVRMVDARGPEPVVGDRQAATLMADDGDRLFEAFAGLHNPVGSRLAWHRIIDDMLRDRFKGQPQRLTVLLGAGLDSRAFRLGSGRWVEQDDAAMMERKERLLPAAACRVPLQRVACELSAAALEATLEPFVTTGRVSVVMEGLLMHMDEAAIREICGVLARFFPNHTLICDLMSEQFARTNDPDLRAAIEKQGGRFKWTPAKPAALFAALGYRQTGIVSIPLRAAEYRVVDMPIWRVRWLQPSIRDGYCVHAFKLD